MIQVGQQVPDFTLTTYEPTTKDFGSYSLAKAKKDGKWTLLFFYPADYTFVCATEFAALADLQDKFAKLGCNIVSVSGDTQFVHLAWQREEKDLENVKFPMGADRNGDLAKMFGIWNGGFSLRGSYLIGPDGKLMGAEVNFLNLGRNVDEQLRKLEANLHLAKSPDGTGCPAKWKQKGDKTIQGGAKLVGRVHDAHQK